MSVQSWISYGLRKWGVRSRRKSLLGSRRFTFFLSFSSFHLFFFSSIVADIVSALRVFLTGARISLFLGTLRYRRRPKASM